MLQTSSVRVSASICLERWPITLHAILRPRPRPNRRAAELVASPNLKEWLRLRPPFRCAKACFPIPTTAAVADQAPELKGTYDASNPKRRLRVPVCMIFAQM